MENTPVEEKEQPIAVEGGFISVPQVFAKAQGDRRHVAKVWYRPAVDRDGSPVLELSTTAILLDLNDVEPKMDLERLTTDCDLLQKVFTEHLEEIERMLVALQTGTPEGLAEATRIGEALGMTEDAAVDQGGGFICLAIGLGLLLLASACGGAMAEKPAKTSTHPKQPTPPPPPR